LKRYEQKDRKKIEQKDQIAKALSTTRQAKGKERGIKQAEGG